MDAVDTLAAIEAVVNDYFVNGEPNEYMDEVAKRLRIDVDSEGNLRMKIGEGVWTAPIVSTPDPYRDS